MDEKQEKTEAQIDWEWDEKQDALREAREEPFQIWKSDNLVTLRIDFCEEYNDEFNKFCRSEFRSWGRD